MEPKVFSKTGSKESDIARLVKGDMMFYDSNKDHAILIQFNRDNKIFIASKHEQVSKQGDDSDMAQKQTVSHKGKHYTKLPIEGLFFGDKLREVLEQAKELTT